MTKTKCKSNQEDKTSAVNYENLMQDFTCKIKTELYNSVSKSSVYCRMLATEEHPPRQASPQPLSSQVKSPIRYLLLLSLQKTFCSSLLIMDETNTDEAKGIGSFQHIL